MGIMFSAGATTYSASNYEGTIFNGPSHEAGNLEVGPHNAVIIVDGDFAIGRVGLRFLLVAETHLVLDLFQLVVADQSHADIIGRGKDAR